MDDLIKRYDIPIIDDMVIGVVDDPNGDWVSYEDHATALAAAHAEIARLTARADRMEAALRACARTEHDCVAKMHLARAALTDKPDAGDGE